MGTELDTPTNPWVRALDNNSTQTAVAADTRPADTTTKPVTVDSATATSNVAVIPGSGNQMFLRFFGTGVDNVESMFGIYGVSKIIAKPDGSDTAAQTWTYQPIIYYDVYLSAATGIAGGVVDDTERYADRIVATGTATASTNLVIETFSPADDTPGWVLLDTVGFEYIYVTADLDGTATGTPMTAWNVMYRVL